MWAFDAGTGAYVSGVVTGAGGSYSLGLLPDTYKLWITDAPGYPDQAYGPDGTFANATVVDLTTTDKTANIVLSSPGHPHRVRHGDRRWRRGSAGPWCGPSTRAPGPMSAAS